MNSKDDWPDPHPVPGTTLNDLDRRFTEVIAELTQARREIEEQKVLLYVLGAGMLAVLWKLY
jgi:hypothetical protein